MSRGLDFAVKQLRHMFPYLSSSELCQIYERYGSINQAADYIIDREDPLDKLQANKKVTQKLPAVERADLLSTPGSNDESSEVMPNLTVKKKLSHVLSSSPKPTDSSPVKMAGNLVQLKRKRVICEESDEEDFDELVQKKPSYSSGDENESLNVTFKYITDFFNSASDDELQDFANCSMKQVALIRESRPFASYLALYNVMEETKGLKTKIIDDYQETVECQETLDEVVIECEKISEKLNSALSELFSEDLKSDQQETGIHATHLYSTSTSIVKQPASINPQLRLKDYQILGINWLLTLYNDNLSGILADEMGLGKTAQVISFIAHLVETGVQGPFLVVVPVSTMQNWSREATKWCPSLQVVNYHGSQNERLDLRVSLSEAADFNLMITTYTMLNNREDRQFLRKCKFLYMILDEGHMIKNINSQRYQNLISIKTRYRLLLTGTPLQNNLQELLSLLIFIMPELFAEKEEQLRKMFSFKKETSLSAERIKRAKSILSPFILRRKKIHVLDDLPKKIEHVIHCQAMARQREGYENVRKASRSAASNRDSTDSGRSTTSNVHSRTLSNILMKLRKASLHPLLSSDSSSIYYNTEKRNQIADIIYRKTDYFVWSEGSKKTYSEKAEEAKKRISEMMDYEIADICNEFKALEKYRLSDSVWMESGKVLVLLKILEHHAGIQIPLDHLQKAKDDLGSSLAEIMSSKFKLQQKENEKSEKILVFSQFVIMLDILEKLLGMLGVKLVRMDGSMSTAERQDVIDKFESDENVKVFLLSTKAGGFGINLTAASVVVLFDLDFNPFNDAQAEDRAHRVGQEKDVTIYKLLTKDTIEERIFELASQKLRLDNSVAGTTAVAAKSIKTSFNGPGGYAAADDDDDDNEDDVKKLLMEELR